MTIRGSVDSRKDFYRIADDVTVHEAARYLREKGSGQSAYAIARASSSVLCHKAIFPISSRRTIALPGCTCLRS